MSSSNCSFLTCIQVSQEAGNVVWYFHLLKNFPKFVVIHTVKVICIVNEAEINVFLEFSCFFMIQWSLAIWPIWPIWPEVSLSIWKFSVHVLLKPSLENFDHHFASMWKEYSYVVVWTFFDIVLLWDWNKNWPFLVLWLLLSSTLSNFLSCWDLLLAAFKYSV